MDGILLCPRTQGPKNQNRKNHTSTISYAHDAIPIRIHYHKDQRQKMSNPPPLPPRPSRTTSTTPPSSRPVGPPPPLPPRPSRTTSTTPPSSRPVGPPPLLPAVSVVPTSNGWFSDLKKKYTDCFPKSTYTSINDEYETVELLGNKGSRMLVLSVIVNTFLSLIPVLTGDTIGSTCEEGVCVDAGDITYLYVTAAFIKYPWILMLYWNTGLWFTGSGLSIKCFIMRDAILNSIIDYSIPSLLEPLKWVVGFVVSFEQLIYWAVEILLMVAGSMSFCNCSQEMNYLTFVGIGYIFIPAFRLLGFVFGWFENLEKRIKVFTWLDCLQDTLFNIFIYTGTYGFVGILFVIFPVLGYIEAFSFLYS